MAFIVPKSNLANALKATTYVVPSSLAPAAPLRVSSHSIPVDSPPYYLSSSKMNTALPFGSGIPRAISGVTVKAQYRFSHTDVKFPEYLDIRRNSTLDPAKPARETRDARKAFSYAFTAGAISVGAVSAKTAVTKVAKYFGFNQDSLALGTIELDISSVPEGKSVTMVWQGKPLFVKHRTQDEIIDAQNTPMSDLRDPQDDSARVQKPEWLITLGICTHLGCIPIAGKGDFLGGYFCPCHGSHYDSSGRIRKGPAPENLEIPPYQFISDTTIVVG